VEITNVFDKIGDETISAMLAGVLKYYFHAQRAKYFGFHA